MQITSPSVVDAAKQHMVDTLMKFPMDGSALVTAFVNCAIQSARIDALQDLIIAAGEHTQERFDELLAQHLTAKADQMAQMLNKPRIQLATALNG